MLTENKRHTVTVANYYDDEPSKVMNSITGQIVHDSHGKVVRLDIYDAETDVEITLGEFDFDEIKEMVEFLDK